MNKFSFGRKVEIEGKVYVLSSDRAKIARALELQASKSKVIGASKLPEDKKLAEIERLCRESADSILGEGAFDEIFSSRTFSPADFTDLIYFLTDEFKAWNEEVQERSLSES